MNYNICWQDAKVAAFRSNAKNLKVIKDIDFVDINTLLGLELQKDKLLQNTKNFIENKPANHALLWGEPGCGKSSLCKAVFTKFLDNGLKIIEIKKEDLSYLIDILDEIRELEYKFIIFCDDLSFEHGENSYKHLKPLLDGSMEKPPKNVLIYATSNRRHLLSEYKSDNLKASISSDEIHLRDAVNERISLSERFGLQLSFYSGNFDEYLRIVESYFAASYGLDEVKFREKFEEKLPKLREEAKQFAMLRAARNGRIAKQFFNYYKEEFQK